MVKQKDDDLFDSLSFSMGDLSLTPISSPSKPGKIADPGTPVLNPRSAAMYASSGLRNVLAHTSERHAAASPRRNPKVVIDSDEEEAEPPEESGNSADSRLKNATEIPSASAASVSGNSRNPRNSRSSATPARGTILTTKPNLQPERDGIEASGTPSVVHSVATSTPNDRPDPFARPEDKFGQTSPLRSPLRSPHAAARLGSRPTALQKKIFGSLSPNKSPKKSQLFVSSVHAATPLRGGPAAASTPMSQRQKEDFFRPMDVKDPSWSARARDIKTVAIDSPVKESERQLHETWRKVDFVPDSYRFADPYRSLASGGSAAAPLAAPLTNHSSQDPTAALKGLFDSLAAETAEAEAEASEGTEQKGKDAKPGEDTTKSGNSPNCSVPGLSVSLLDHQVKGLAFLQRREGKKIEPKGGLLCDDMGLGKTVQTLALILAKPPSRKFIANHDPANGVIRFPSTLVVAPLALASQWQAEIAAKAPGLRAVVHHGPRRASEWQALRGYDVIITTYQILVSEFTPEMLQKKPGARTPLYAGKFWRIVLDEAHTIKNRLSKTAQACCALEASRRWCLTGTPVQNGVDELQSLLKFVRVAPFDDFRVWKEKIAGPITGGREELALKRLHAVLSVVMLRRTKAVLAQGRHAAQLALPARRVHRVGVEFSSTERQFYERLSSRIEEAVDGCLGSSGGEAANYMNALVLLLRLRQACCHWKLVVNSKKNRSVEDDDEGLEEYLQRRSSPEKGKPAVDRSPRKSPLRSPVRSPLKSPLKSPRKLSGDDIDDLSLMMTDLSVVEQQCSICLAPMTLADKHDTYCRKCAEEIAVEQMAARDRSSTKIQEILRILRTEPGRKTIVFSQFTTLFDLLEPELTQAGIAYVRYDGKMARQKRDVALEKFKDVSRDTAESARIPVLLCSLKCGALGLNLIVASRIVLVDPWWNPQISEQAIDRVHRFGQTRDVDVYEIKVNNTVEERILALQDKKRELAKAVVEGGNGGGLGVNMKLTLNDLLYLFNRDQ